MFFGSGGKYDDVPDLDDLPEIGSNFQNKDKFNQVMSSSKEGGGLLASIGLKKDDVKDGESEDAEEDPHKKSNLFDTSKDKIGQGKAGKKEAVQSDEDDFDLGFGSGKKDKEPKSNNKSGGAGEFEMLGGMSDGDDENAVEENSKAITEQFRMIYDSDPELRKALEKSDVASFSVEEKF